MIDNILLQPIGVDADHLRLTPSDMNGANNASSSQRSTTSNIPSDPSVSNSKLIPPPQSSIIKEEQEIKKMKRVLANRKSARKSRERRRQLEEDLQRSVLVLSRQNGELKSQNVILKGQVAALMRLFTDTTTSNHCPTGVIRGREHLLLPPMCKNALLETQLTNATSLHNAGATSSTTTMINANPLARRMLHDENEGQFNRLHLSTAGDSNTSTFPLAQQHQLQQLLQKELYQSNNIMDVSALQNLIALRTGQPVPSST